MPQTNNPAAAGTGDDDSRAVAALEGMLGGNSAARPNNAPEDDHATDQDDAPENEDAGASPDGEEQEDAGQDQGQESAKIRLKDGRMMTLDEVEKGVLFQADYTRKSQALAEERKAFEGRTQALLQAEQQAQTAFQQAAQYLASLKPQEPDYRLFEQDPYAYWQQQAAYQDWQKQASELRAQWDASQQRHAAQVQTAEQEWRQTQQEQLFEAMPELRQAEKRKAFQTLIAEHIPSAYGITQEELNQVWDARHARILHDAARWQQLQRGKSGAVAKAKQAPPVAVPGARPVPGQTAVKSHRNDMARLKSTGKEADAARVIERFLK